MIKSLIQTSFVSYISLAFTLMGSIFIARHYGPSGQGELAALLLIPQIIISFGDLGTAESIMYHLSKKTEWFLLSRKTIIKIVLMIVGLMSLLFSIYLTFFSYSKTFFIILLGYLYVVLLFINQIYSFIVRGQLKIKTYNTGIIILNTTVLIAIIICVIQSLSIEYLFIGYLFSNAASILYLFFKTKLQVNTSKKKEYSIKEVLYYGIKIYSYKVLNSTESQFDKFIIASYLVSSQLGLYSVAIVMASGLYLLLVKPITSIILPILNKIEDIKEKQKLITLMNKVIFWAGILFGILLMVFSNKLLVYVYGIDYLPALIPLWILLVGVILKSPMSILGYYFKSIGTPEVMVRISIVTVILNIVAGIIFIPSYGIIAAAIISTSTYTIYSILLSRKYVKTTKKGYLNQYLFSKVEVDLVKSHLINFINNKR